MHISTSVWGVRHQNAGQNIQHSQINLVKKCQSQKSDFFETGCLIFNSVNTMQWSKLFLTFIRFEVFLKYRIPNSDLEIFLGLTDLGSKLYTERKVVESIIADKFILTNGWADNIALLKLEKDVNFQWEIFPICLPCGIKGKTLLLIIQ